MMFLHIVFFKIKGVEWLHEVTQEAHEDDEDWVVLEPWVKPGHHYHLLYRIWVEWQTIKTNKTI